MQERICLYDFLIVFDTGFTRELELLIYALFLNELSTVNKSHMFLFD